MSFYDLTKEQRAKKVDLINSIIRDELNADACQKTYTYFSNPDTYIRKAAYISIGRIYFNRMFEAQRF